MNAWHVTPEYINRRWTEEEFLLLFKMRNRRIRLESGKPIKKRLTGPLSKESFAASFGAHIETVQETKES